MRIIFVFIFSLIFSFYLSAQNVSSVSSKIPLNEQLKPFYHGVASGDPLFDRVIIWTRVTPSNQEKSIRGKWKIASDPQMKAVVKSGKFATNAEKDFTVKIDVTGLTHSTTYYYQFFVGEVGSVIGKTRTTPLDEATHLRFGVVSCSNFQAGYFNAYARLADRNDLDAIIHLGDYIYEYPDGGYGDSALIKLQKRPIEPKAELLTLEDYRKRYSTYRLDEDLRKAHQQHPFIVVWDDHETANDAYTEGAENHNEKGKDEGNWEKRKEAARKAYIEWMPIRGIAKPLYRKIIYGQLAEIILLDTRLEGRQKQIRDVQAEELYDKNRTILGLKQREWFLKSMKESRARWKIIANQVIFSEFNVGWAAAGLPDWTPEKLESIFLDIWDGYPVERQNIIRFLTENDIDNVVFITGDVHSSFAFDVALRPSVFSEKGKLPDYDPKTGINSVAVEFVTPSITSSNFDENIGIARAKMLEYQINKNLPNGINPNPHLKFADLTKHGYFVLDIIPEKVQADWYFVDSILEKNHQEAYKEGWFVENGKNYLQKANQASKTKAKQDIPAPNKK